MIPGGRRTAVITGLGAVSGFGEGAEVLWRNLVEGRRAMRHNEAMAAAGLPSLVASVPGEDPLGNGDRAVSMALRAAAEAARDAGGLVAGDGLGVTFGTTLGGIGGWLQVIRAHGDSGRAHGDSGRAHGDPGSGRSDGATGDGDAEFGRPRGWTWSGPAEAVAREHGAGGPVQTVSVACASANAAIGAALDLVRTGRAMQVLAGGADAIGDFVAAGFASLKAVDPAPCRPFDRDRRGLNLGEGACFVVVEDEAHALRRGARIRAVLAGYADAADANHMTGPDPTGRGAARAMKAALDDAGLAPDDVDYVSAHGTATVFNDLMEHHALHVLLGERAARVPTNSIKGSIGHTLGAAGAFEALLCVRSLEEGLIAPTVGLVERDPAIALDVVTSARSVPLRAVLSTSSGFGGTNASIVLTRSPHRAPDRAIGRGLDRSKAGARESGE